jgi:hypothetical protein
MLGLPAPYRTPWQYVLQKVNFKLFVPPQLHIILITKPLWPAVKASYYTLFAYLTVTNLQLRKRIF